ncbi:uncharacterized protein C2845_PM16G01440 [Panicum miliaceum]|uniref:KIB1-4 beta-propeller domain-containing protein n=1 Tax=Panicum miliaceum TaxID=4540 RepID=A0A3L6PZ46_PANMI|nr:uncharacterized protein C2845_PM16G01440 [Panicum miliaceum]
MANPATGEHADLPAITTIPFLNSLGGRRFCLDVAPFLQIRFGGPPPPEDKDWGLNPPRTSTLTAAQMRQKFYRKVIFSAHIGAPAFAAAEDPVPVWRMAYSPEGIKDAIHHIGRFYSVTYTGRVEAWQCNDKTGEFTSQMEKKHLRCKYLAASTDGRLMAVLKHTEEVVEEQRSSAPGANYQGSYYDKRDDTELRVTSVYCLKRGKVIKRIAEQGEHPYWPPPAWFTPSFL